jgi:hypothetical protein
MFRAVRPRSGEVRGVRCEQKARIPMTATMVKSVISNRMSSHRLTTQQLEQTVRERMKEKEKLMKDMDKEMKPLREELEARAQKNLSKYQGMTIALFILVVILIYFVVQGKPGTAIE